MQLIHSKPSVWKGSGNAGEKLKNTFQNVKKNIQNV